MDFYKDSLSTIIKTFKQGQGRIPLKLVKLFAYQIFLSLAYIHSKKLCHCDIKPQNFVVGSTSWQIKLCDFGSAKRLTQGRFLSYGALISVL